MNLKLAVICLMSSRGHTSSHNLIPTLINVYGNFLEKEFLCPPKPSLVFCPNLNKLPIFEVKFPRAQSFDPSKNLIKYIFLYFGLF